MKKKDNNSENAGESPERDEEKTVSSLSLLNATLESTVNGIFVVDLFGRVTLWNNKFVELWHIPAEVLATHLDETLLNSILVQLAQPAAFLAKVRDLYGHPEHSSSDVLELADGRVFSRYSQPQKVGDAIVGRVWSFQDITEQKLTEEALRASEERFKKLFVEAPLGIALVDSLTGRLCEVNPMFARIAGRPMEEIMQLDWMSITHPNDVGKDLDNMALLNAGKINGFQSEKRYLHPDGTAVWVNMTVAKVKVDDKARPRHLCMVADITANRKAELALKESAESKLMFVSQVSHELRSTLTAITMGINIIMDEPDGLNQEQKILFELVHNNAERLGRLVNNVLDSHKMAAGKMPFNILENDIDDLIQTTVRSMGLLAKNKGLGLTVDVSAGLPRAMFDKDKIIQVLTNLLSNAITHTEKGIITVHVAHEKDMLHVMVRDTGHGIKTEDLPKLFQPFEQLCGVSGGKTGGTGLGLTISKEIIIAHNGKIWAESQPGKGSVFHFMLPVTRSGVKTAE